MTVGFVSLYLVAFAISPFHSSFVIRFSLAPRPSARRP